MNSQVGRSYFQFSKKERHGIMAILCVILLLLFLPNLYSRWLLNGQEGLEKNAMPVSALADSMEQIMMVSARNNPDYSGDSVQNRIAGKKQESFNGRLFYFDPNQLDQAGWISLGVSEKTASTILKYREKGGRFKRPEDLGKIWGLSPELATRLRPWVRLEKDEPVPSMAPAPERYVAKKQPRLLDINRADSAAWEALPGIGPSLAKRIVNFRDRLGGFYSLEQVAETFGLPDSVYRRILPILTYQPVPLRPMPINQATLEQMKSHPYIRYKLARAIESYRNQHGAFAQVSDIRQIMLVTDSLYQKLEPYLTLN